MGDKQTLFIYKKAYGWFQCERCRKTYSADWVESCLEMQYTPDLNYCQNCGARIEEVIGGPNI